MYAPFSHIRRFILCALIGIQPEKPLSSLTLLLVFTILILVCLWFYQPFLNQITDYIAIGTELTIATYTIVIMVLGLNIMDTSATWIVGIVAAVIALIGLVIGTIWLMYLTFQAIKENFCLTKEEKNMNDLMNMLVVGDDPMKARQIAISTNKGLNQEGEDECSANNLIIGNEK